MVRETSTIAYRSITNSGVLGSQQNQIIHFLRFNKVQNPDWNFTRKEISKILDIEINAISGRVNELVQSGEIVEDERRPCSHTNRLVTPVRLR
jgi:predicted transcriptional regulator